MKLQNINPYLRAAMIQPAVFEGESVHMAYDHRLFYVLEGDGVLMTKDDTQKISADTLLFFRPQFGYYFHGKMRMIVLNFDLTRKAADRESPICPPPASEFDPALIFDETTADEIAAPLICPNSRHLLENLLTIVHNFDPSDPLADAASSAILKKLLTDLARGEQKQGDPTKFPIEQIQRYLRLYAAEIKDNSEIGRRFGYHPVYIAALFRERTGETLHHAIMAERIRLATEWLTRTDHSVEEIAYDTGFSSRSHFCTVFKRFTGQSPAAFRRSRQSPLSPTSIASK